MSGISEPTQAELDAFDARMTEIIADPSILKKSAGIPVGRPHEDSATREVPGDDLSPERRASLRAALFQCSIAEAAVGDMKWQHYPR